MAKLFAIVCASSYAGTMLAISSIALGLYAKYKHDTKKNSNTDSEKDE